MFFPLKRPKLGNLVFTMIQALSLYSVVLGHFFPSYAKPLMMIGFAGLGFGRAASFLPYLIAYQNLQSDEDIVAVNLWQSLSIFGYAIVYFIDYLFTHLLSQHWSVELSVTLLIFIFLGILVYAVLN